MEGLDTEAHLCKLEAGTYLLVVARMAMPIEMCKQVEKAAAEQGVDLIILRIHGDVNRVRLLRVEDAEMVKVKGGE